MKKAIVFFAVLFFFGTAYADQWCEWDGTQGVNCQSDSRGYILVDGFKTKTPSIANAAGWYHVTVTQPTIGTNQVTDAEQWSFADNEISKTWTVRDLTQTEIDEREARAMDIGQYYLWKALIARGVITQQQAATYLPQELIDAYLARQALVQ